MREDASAMNLLIEFFAVIGALTILAAIGIYTICWMACIPGKSLHLESNQRDQITGRLYNWNWMENGYDLTVTEREYVEGELYGVVQSTIETDSKDSQKVLDTVDWTR